MAKKKKKMKKTPNTTRHPDDRLSAEELRYQAESAAEAQGGTVQSWINFLKSRYARIILILILVLGAAASQAQTYGFAGGGVNMFSSRGFTTQGALGSVGITRVDTVTSTYGYYVTAAASAGAYYDPEYLEVAYMSGSVSVGITNGSFLAAGFRVGFVNATNVERDPISGATGNFAFFGLEFEPTILEPDHTSRRFTDNLRLTVPLHLTLAFDPDNSMWAGLTFRLAYPISK